MDRRSFLLGAVAMPVVSCLPALAVRHETIDLTAHVGLHVENGKLIATVDSINTDDVVAALRSMRGGDMLTIRLNGETVGTVSA